MPIARTRAQAASQARIAQVAKQVKTGAMSINEVQPLGFRAKVRSMASATVEQLSTLGREARQKAAT